MECQLDMEREMLKSYTVVERIVDRQVGGVPNRLKMSDDY